MFTGTDINNCKIEKSDIDYELLLLTYYNNLNNKLHNMTGDKETLENVKKMVDEEMYIILRGATCRILTIKGDE